METTASAEAAETAASADTADDVPLSLHTAVITINRDIAETTANSTSHGPAQDDEEDFYIGHAIPTIMGIQHKLKLLTDNLL